MVEKEGDLDSEEKTEKISEPILPDLSELKNYYENFWNFLSILKKVVDSPTGHLHYFLKYQKRIDKDEVAGQIEIIRSRSGVAKINWVQANTAVENILSSISESGKLVKNHETSDRRNKLFLDSFNSLFSYVNFIAANYLKFKELTESKFSSSTKINHLDAYSQKLSEVEAFLKNIKEIIFLKNERSNETLINLEVLKELLEKTQLLPDLERKIYKIFLLKAIMEEN